MTQQGPKIALTLLWALNGQQVIEAIGGCSSSYPNCDVSDEVSWLLVRHFKKPPDVTSQSLPATQPLANFTAASGKLRKANSTAIASNLSEALSQTNFSMPQSMENSMYPVARAAKAAEDAFRAMSLPDLPTMFSGRQEVGWGRRHQTFFFFTLHTYDAALYLDRSSSLWGQANINDIIDQMARDAPGKASLLLIITTPLATNSRLGEELHNAIDIRVPPGSDSRALQQLDELVQSGPAIGGGSRIRIDFTHAGIDLEVDGHDLGSIESDWITKSIFATFLDANPLIPSLAERVRNQLAHPDLVRWSPGESAYE